MPRQSRPCPVCLSLQAQPVYENTMASLDGMDMSYTVARCERCGFHFGQQLASDATINRYYKAVSKYDIATATSALDQTRIEAAVSICQAHSPRDAMVIDLGCGDGAFLAGLQAAGFSNLHGIDPAPLSAKRAHDRFSLSNILVSTIDQAHKVLPLEKADLVCMMAVIEHLPQLRRDMERLLARLRTGCQILVEVPALDLFEADGAEPLGELSLEHIQFFGQRSLENFFEALGTATVAVELQRLPMLRSGSLFGLFAKTGEPSSRHAPLISEPKGLQPYIEASLQNLTTAIEAIPQRPFVIYGAGSHTARLIPKLQQSHPSCIRGIVDGNPNLQGKIMGAWAIQPPDSLQNDRSLPVLISSYRARNEIERHLRQACPSRPLVQLYSNA